MARVAGTDGPDRSRRYRARRRAGGLKLIRLWVPAPQAPGFRSDAEQQAGSLRGAPEEHDALAFIEAAADRGDDAPRGGAI